MTVDDNNTLFVVQQAGTAYKLSGHEFILALTSILDGHGGISGIEKTNTAGLIDTYTITYADRTIATYTVTNGKGISNVVTYYAVSDSDTTAPSNWVTTKPSLTSTNRYLWSYQTITYNDGADYSTTKVVIGVWGDKGDKGDTGRGIASIEAGTRIAGQYTPYTVTMTDGTTETFRAYDGVGITSIAKTATAGLADTYTITYSDGTTSTYTVTNGSSIESISKTSTSGLVDTYTVQLTNGNTHTFTVTNAKSILSVTQIGGNHAAGTSDTYRIDFNDGDSVEFRVYNGANGTGAVSSVAGIGVSGASGDVPLLLKGLSSPTQDTVGQENQLYFNTSSGMLYICLGETGGTYSWVGTGVLVDSALSTTSENPVRNSAITAKVGTAALNTTAQNLSDAVNELRTQVLSNSATKVDDTVVASVEQSESTSHVVGEYMFHVRKLYRCIEAYTGSWDASKWEPVTVTGEIDSKQDQITDSGILKGDGNGGVSAAVPGTDYETPAGAKALGLTAASVGDLVRVNAVDAQGRPTSWAHVALVLTPSAAIAIPANGSSVSYNITGLTSDHQLVRWNFANNGTAIAENQPPCDLSWITYDGYFAVTNDGGTTSATIQPVFELPAAIAAIVRS